MRDGFYKAFEERHRGSRESITLRLLAYLPFVEPLAQLEKGAQVIDLGCGRGEWLELMDQIGFFAYGVDLDTGMLEDCYERGLTVEQGDAVAYIAKLPDESQTIVSAFHVVEHISFKQLRTVVSESFRVLKPGGLLIMETPNPENIIVATKNFYLDPTHQRPIPPQLLSFLPEYYGFARTKILRLQESKDLTKNESLKLNDVLEGVSPDYTVIAQKAAPAETLVLFDKVFEQEYGLTLNTLAVRYDGAIAAKAKQAEVTAQETHAKAQEAHAKAQEAHAKAQEAHAKAQEAHAKAQEAEILAGQTETALTAIYKSRSWRITAPMRWAGDFSRWVVRGSIAWLTFTPGSRPRRILRSVLIFIKSRISDRSLLIAVGSKLLSPFPQLEVRLRIIGNPPPPGRPHILNPMEDGIEGIENLSPRARKIYFDLKAAIEQHRKEQR